MAVLEVFPEARDQGHGQLDEAGVVDAGLALAQVVHEQVADRPAGKVIAVDELLDCQLPSELGADHPGVGRGAGREHPGLVQELVEERAVPVAAGPVVEDPPAAIQQLDAVAGGDVGDQAALGGHDQGDPLDGRGERGPPDGARVQQPSQGGDPGGVAGPAHLLGDPGRGGGGQQPGQGRAQDVAADQLDHARAENVVDLAAPGAEFPGGLQLRDCLVPPVSGPVGPGAAGVPAFLPRRPGVQLQPVEDFQHGQLPVVPRVDVLGQERRRQHPPHHREPVLGRLRPGPRDRAGREPPCQRQRLGAGLACRGPGRCRRRGHQRPFPNSTSRLSGR